MGVLQHQTFCKQNIVVNVHKLTMFIGREMKCNLGLRGFVYVSGKVSDPIFILRQSMPYSIQLKQELTMSSPRHVSQDHSLRGQAE